MLYMWKGKQIPLTITAAALVLITCSGLTACGSSAGNDGGEVLLYEEKVTGSAVEGAAKQYETVTVRREDYQEEYSDTGELEYTDIDTVYINEEDAVLDSIKVKKGQRIQKGDVLAVFHVETSDTKLAKQKLENQQARANYESGLSNLENSLSQAKKEMNLLESEAEKKVKKLEIKKQEKELEAYKKGEKEILALEKEYAKLVRMQKPTKLLAKKGGVVTAVKGREYVGEEIDASTQLIEFRNNDKWMIKVKDPESKLRYNMDVSVRLGKTLKDYQYEVKGKVITASDITGVEAMDESGENIVYIEVSESAKKKYDFENNNIYIHAVSFEVKNVLMVDAKAVYSESVGFANKLYVYVLENGNLHKRFIVSSYSNEKEFLVEQGVKENQTLAIVDM